MGKMPRNSRKRYQCGLEINVLDMFDLGELGSLGFLEFELTGLGAHENAERFASAAFANIAVRSLVATPPSPTIILQVEGGYWKKHS
jgi:hypothetical protein